MRRVLHWTPRILAVGVALFLALFAFDVFGEFDSVVDTLIALTMHLIPTLLLLVAAGIAWRWQFTGGVLFVVLGVVSIVFFNTYRHLISFLSVSTPIIMVGLLFLWDALAGEAHERSPRKLA